MMKQDFLVIENSHICPTRPLPLLYLSVSDFQFSSAGDRWLRACGAYLRKLNI